MDRYEMYRMFNDNKIDPFLFHFTDMKVDVEENISGAIAINQTDPYSYIRIKREMQASHLGDCFWEILRFNGLRSKYELNQVEHLFIPNKSIIESFRSKSAQKEPSIK